MFAINCFFFTFYYLQVFAYITSYTFRINFTLGCFSSYSCLLVDSQLRNLWWVMIFFFVPLNLDFGFQSFCSHWYYFKKRYISRGGISSVFIKSYYYISVLDGASSLKYMPPGSAAFTVILLFIAFPANICWSSRRLQHVFSVTILRLPRRLAKTS